MGKIQDKINKTKKKVSTTQGLLKLVDKVLKSCDKAFANGQKIFKEARTQTSKVEIAKKLLTIAEDEDVKQMVSNMKELKDVSYKEILDSVDDWNIITKLKVYKTLRRIQTWTDKIGIVNQVNSKCEKDISEFDGNLEKEYFNKYKKSSLSRTLNFFAKEKEWESTINYLKQKKE